MAAGGLLRAVPVPCPFASYTLWAADIVRVPSLLCCPGNAADRAAAGPPGWPERAPSPREASWRPAPAASRLVGGRGLGVGPGVRVSVRAGSRKGGPSPTQSTLEHVCTCEGGLPVWGPGRFWDLLPGLRRGRGEVMHTCWSPTSRTRTRTRSPPPRVGPSTALCPPGPSVTLVKEAGKGSGVTGPAGAPQPWGGSAAVCDGDVLPGRLTPSRPALLCPAFPAPEGRPCHRGPPRAGLALRALQRTPGFHGHFPSETESLSGGTSSLNCLCPSPWDGRRGHTHTHTHTCRVIAWVSLRPCTCQLSMCPGVLPLVPPSRPQEGARALLAEQVFR